MQIVHKIEIYPNNMQKTYLNNLFIIGHSQSGRKNMKTKKKLQGLV
jgi:hypothetical protein